MSTEVYAIKIQQSGAEKVASDVEKIGGAAQRTEKKVKQLEVTSKRTFDVMSQFRGALVALAAVRAATGLVDFIDSATRLDNSLKVATKSADEFARAQGFIRQISKESRTDIEANAMVYSRLLRSTEGLGFSTKDLEKTMEGLTYAIKVGGATSMEARNSLIQFSQALASGALRGDELRSVSEQLPALANAIGKEFNMSGGQLIAFAKANPGILETEKVVRGVMKAAEELKAQFLTMTPTLAEGFTVMKTNVIGLIQDINAATGIFSGLARVLIWIGESMVAIGPAILAAGFVGLVGTIIRLNSVMLPLNAQMVVMALNLRLIAAAQLLLNSAMNANPLVRLVTIVGLVVYALITWYEKSEILRFAINNIINVISIMWTAITQMVGIINQAVGNIVNWGMVTEVVGIILSGLAHVIGVVLMGALSALMYVIAAAAKVLEYLGVVSEGTAVKVQDVADKAAKAAADLYVWGEATQDGSNKLSGFSTTLEDFRSKLNGVGGGITKLANETDDVANATDKADRTAKKYKASMWEVGLTAEEAAQEMGGFNDTLNTFTGLDGQVYNGLNGMASGLAGVASNANNAANAMRNFNAASSASRNSGGGMGGSTSGGKAYGMASVASVRNNINKPMNYYSQSQGKVVSGARANGGPVTGGKTYMVGEKGPELFTPKEDGAIISNKSLGGAYDMLARQKQDIIDSFKKASDFFRGGGILAGPAASRYMAMMNTMQGRLNFINKMMKQIEEMNAQKAAEKQAKMIKRELKNGFGDDGAINLPGFEDYNKPAPKIDFQTPTPWQKGGAASYSAPSASGYSSGGSMGGGGGGGGAASVDNSIHVTMNISTQDAGSFRQNQAQIEGQMLAMVERAQRRKKRK